MTTVNLTFTPAVSASGVSITQTAASTPQTLAAYNTWYEAGRLNWTAVANDIVACTGYVTFTISSPTGTGTDRLSVFLRGRLRDATVGQDVWAGTNQQQCWTRIGAVTYGNLTQQVSINERFATSSILIPGHAYVWYVELMKQQVVGIPTMTVVINDDSIFSDAATRVA